MGYDNYPRNHEDNPWEGLSGGEESRAEPQSLKEFDRWLWEAHRLWVSLAFDAVPGALDTVSVEISPFAVEPNRTSFDNREAL
jgi:hypothetical protein